jgi:hypothetical protein
MLSPADNTPEVIVVELRPYQERRRTRALATGIMLGILFAGFVAPLLADLLNEVLAELGPYEPTGVGEN